LQNVHFAFSRHRRFQMRHDRLHRNFSTSSSYGIVLHLQIFVPIPPRSFWARHRPRESARASPWRSWGELRRQGCKSSLQLITHTHTHRKSAYIHHTHRKSADVHHTHRKGANIHHTHRKGANITEADVGRLSAGLNLQSDTTGAGISNDAEVIHTHKYTNTHAPKYTHTYMYTHAPKRAHTHTYKHTPPCSYLIQPSWSRMTNEKDAYTRTNTHNNLLQFNAPYLL
jgi:hypothetical protein